MNRQRQQSQRGNATATRGGGSSGKGGGGGGGGKGGGNGKAAGKKPIKVVYISNPMRVKTSAAGFRALVQELTGRNADPSKYSPRAAAAAADDDDGGGGGGFEGAEGAGDDGASTTLHESGVGAAASPDTGAACSDADAQVAAGHLPAVAATFDEGDGVGGGGYYDDDDIFRSQLLDTSYSVFSPPTLLYDHPHSKV